MILKLIILDSLVCFFIGGGEMWIGFLLLLNNIWFLDGWMWGVLVGWLSLGFLIL